MLTVSKLAKGCGLSRTTILYYESIGLLRPARRNAANYRSYTERDVQRLAQICSYRNAGLNLDDIHALLESPESDAASILKRRLVELDAEIETRRRHQKAILMLLRSQGSLRRTRMMTKEKWTGIMRAAGFTDGDMHRWHIEFERSAPEDHEEFLGSLHIPKEEIAQIRDWSRNARPPATQRAKDPA
jgi:DNA-binding transcriptional MerR regulator